MRRAHCRAALVGGLLAAAASLGFPAVRRSRAAGCNLSGVTGQPAAAARRAVELLGGMKRFVRAGQRVVVKPNIGFDRTPEQAANTNPLVVAEVVRMALEAGAGEVRVFDRSSHEPRRCYRASGIEAAVAALGDPRARVFVHDPADCVTVPVPRGARLAAWPFLKDAARAEVFINCPVAKHHSMTGLSMGLKNMMGAIGGDRSQMHPAFDDAIVDLHLARPCHLTVLDATRVLVDHGPEGGFLRDVVPLGVVVAGSDAVGVDAYATRFFGARPADVSHVVRAASRGLGSADLDRLGLREEAL